MAWKQVGFAVVSSISCESKSMPFFYKFANSLSEARDEVAEIKKLPERFQVDLRIVRAEVSFDFNDVIDNNDSQEN